MLSLKIVFMRGYFVLLLKTAVRTVHHQRLDCFDLFVETHNNESKDSRFTHQTKYMLYK